MRGGEGALRADLVVNGFDVVAEYGDKDVEGVFVSLLERWTRLAAGRERTVVLLAAPPGAGKSTLAAFLEWYAPQVPGVAVPRAVGIDGFHYPNAYLDTHTTMEDGLEVVLRSRKGAAFTFDVAGLEGAVRDYLTAEAPAPWPVYSRVLHDPVPAAIDVDAPLLLVEGNYLLLDDPTWARVRALAADTVFLRADEGELRERLVARKVRGGMAPDDAETWYQASDGRNVRAVLERSVPANVELRQRGGTLEVVRARS